MEMPELPCRIYTLGEEPPAVHSISYHTCWTLHAALKKALHDDEYLELKESKLGVFIKFQELGFDWASRLVHYMLGFQLDIKKKYELWSLVGPQPMKFSLLEFENLTGLNCEYIEDLERPHSVVTKEIIAALQRCEGWSRDDRKRLAYLAIFTGYIEGRKYSTPTRVSLPRLVMKLERFENYPWGRVAFKVWVYTTLPELGATFGNHLPNNLSSPILAYKGRKGRIQFEEAILSQVYKSISDIIGYPKYFGSDRTRVINFVQKEIGQMFPKWEFDVEDTPAENIIKLMLVKKPWKWTMDCWEVTDTWVNTKPTVEDSPRPRKKARKEAPAEASEEAAAEASEEAAAEAKDIKTMFKDIADAMREGFGTCLKEIKYLPERVEAVEKKVGITTKRKGTLSQNTTSPLKPTLESGIESVNGTNAGRKSLAEDKGPDVPAAVPADASSSKDKAPEPNLVLLDKNQPTVSDLQKKDARYQEKRDDALVLCRAKSDRIRKLAASQQSPSTARVIIPNKKLYPGYNPFAPIDKKKLKELADWLKTCPHYRTPLDKKLRKSRSWWYQILQTSLKWLEDHIDAWINVLRKRYDANPQHFRSERMCFLDHLFAQQWRFNFKDFKDSEPDQNGLGIRLHGGAWNYYAGTIPSFCQSNNVWGTDIDDIYAPRNFSDTHWIAMWISIPKRHIAVFDSICSSISPEELDVVMENFLYMVPYLLVECASSDEQRAQYSLEPFTYERPTNIPPARAGDCGVYTLKYIECYALRIEFSKKRLC
uniref:Ubiquitin-like protease family profile domain-containing protein n=1 Tax=Brassica oleracea var. oleracea TaxID=109376 RepID=A0A0D3D8U5_BRAOL